MPCKLYTLSIQIDILPKSLNKKLRSHFRGNHAENKSWDLIIQCLCAGKKPRRPIKRARLTLTRHAHRTLDYDGLVGSLKPVVDALVTCGVLEDDTWAVTGPWVVDQKFRPQADGPLLEVLLEELP